MGCVRIGALIPKNPQKERNGQNGQKRTKSDINIQKWADIYRNGVKRTETNRNGQKKIEIE